MESKNHDLESNDLTVGDVLDGDRRIEMDMDFGCFVVGVYVFFDKPGRRKR